MKGLKSSRQVSRTNPQGTVGRRRGIAHLLGVASGRTNSRSEIRFKSQTPRDNGRPKHWKLSTGLQNLAIPWGPG